MTEFRKASGTRAQPHCHPLASRICAFSNQISLTGEVLPVPDCRVRSDGAGCRNTKNTNPFRLFTYREYILAPSSSLSFLLRDIFGYFSPFNPIRYASRISPFVCKGVRFAVLVSFVFVLVSWLRAPHPENCRFLPEYFLFRFEIKFCFNLGWIFLFLIVSKVSLGFFFFLTSLRVTRNRRF